jgi:hypothetical protein
MNPENYHYPSRDPIREHELKMKFADLHPSLLADYSSIHPGDTDFLEYMTCYATPEVNDEVFRILDKKARTEERKARRLIEMSRLKSA